MPAREGAHSRGGPDDREVISFLQYARPVGHDRLSVASDDSDERAGWEPDLTQGPPGPGTRRQPVGDTDRQRTFFSQQRGPKFGFATSVHPAGQEPDVIHVRGEVAEQPQVLARFLLRTHKEEDRANSVEAVAPGLPDAIGARDPG